MELLPYRLFYSAVATFWLNGPSSYQKARHLLRPSSLPLLRWTLVLSVHPYLLGAVVPSFYAIGALERIASNKRRFVKQSRRMASIAIQLVNDTNNTAILLNTQIALFKTCDFWLSSISADPCGAAPRTNIRFSLRRSPASGSLLGSSCG